jgi:hypothetical protein
MAAGLLREFIELLVHEMAAIAPESATKQGLSLFVADTQDKKTLVLYDPKGAGKALENSRTAKKITEDDYMNALESCVIGFMVLKKPSYKQRGAYTVDTSAAKGGYGPLMYDIAMSHFGKITPSRKSVSPAAEGVWNYYAFHRKDIHMEPLDDVNNPRTPDADDDSELHKKANINPLNYTYTGAKVDTSRMEQNSERFLRAAEKSRFDRKMLERALRYAGSGFFRSSFLADD